MKINKVKRKILIRNMVEFGLKPMSELVAIMSKFATVGPNANAKPVKAVLDEAGDEEERSGAIQENEDYGLNKNDILFLYSGLFCFNFVGFSTFLPIFSSIKDVVEQNTTIIPIFCTIAV